MFAGVQNRSPTDTEYFMVRFKDSLLRGLATLTVTPYIKEAIG